ncbi:MAG: DUF547 domain-containing protein [Gammaproteobacteria bacterium]|nr:DUF547 domain-containing protein [Gammaproteobacteria bacterium]
MRTFILFVLFLFSSLCYAVSPLNAPANAFDHAIWNSLLNSHVHSSNKGITTSVDYQGVKANTSALVTYLRQLAKVDQKQFDSWPKNDQLAFLINAYNAGTVELIIRAYPNIASIKDLGGFLSSPWKKKFIPLLEHTRSLDDIEHTLIRGAYRYNDPRIHFAVNCASIGCPALRAEAYTGHRLSAQLQDQTKKFLSDPDRNRFEKQTLMVSSIFKWYKKDFEQGWQGFYSLEKFFAHYAGSLSLSAETKQKLENGEIDIIYLDYDWRLNDKQ